MNIPDPVANDGEPIEELRRAVTADAPAIRALTRLAYAKWVPIAGREPLPMRVDYEAALRDHRIDLLYRGGDLAALIETVAEPLALEGGRYGDVLDQDLGFLHYRTLAPKSRPKSRRRAAGRRRGGGHADAHDNVQRHGAAR